MNVLLWIFQALLALFYLAGGAFKTFNPDDVATQITAIPRTGWVALGALEMFGAVLLVVPAVVNGLPLVTPLAAAVLAIETLALAGVYARYSRKLVASNPLVYAVPMGVVAALVAFGRYAVSPLV